MRFILLLLVGHVFLSGCQPKPVVTTLTPTHVKAAMADVLDAFQKCYDQYKVPGIVDIRFVVEGQNGKVLQAKVVGKFGGTPTGECIAVVVDGMEFPRFPGPPVDRSYSVILK